MATAFASDKVLARRTGRCAWLGTDASGYEIRHGPRRRAPAATPLFDDDEGCRVGAVLGTSWHGALEHDALPPRPAGLGRRAARPPLRPRRRPRSRPRARRGSTCSATSSPTTSTPTGCSALIDSGPPTGLPVLQRSAETACCRFVTTADTEILATAAAVRRLPDDFPEVRCANPGGVRSTRRSWTDVLDGARVVLCRVLGGRRGWPDGFDLLQQRCAACGIALLALGGEAEPDAEMTALSTAPAGAVAQAGEYLRHGDVDNVEQLLRFLADTFLLEGHGFEAPHEVADLGVYVPGAGDVPLERVLEGHDPGRPTIGICFYRSHRADRQHRLRRRAVRGDRGRGRQCARGLELLAARATATATCPPCRCSTATSTRC